MPTTDRELSAIAAAAMIGDSRIPSNGYKIPAATGIPMPFCLKRLRRIEGQVRGLQRMVDEDKYCIEILTQVSAATKALQAVAIGLLEDHLGHCVAEAIAEGGDDGSAKITEASQAVARLVRS